MDSESKITPAPILLRGKLSSAAGAVEQAKLDGFKTGFAQGLREGMLEGGERAKNAAAQAENERNDERLKARNKYQDRLSHARDGVEELGLKLAGRVVSAQLQRGDDAFLHLFSCAASHIGKADSAVLRAGPGGCEIAARYREKLEKSINGLGALEIRRDGNDDGLCIIETPNGSVDASVKVQMEKALKLMSFK